MFKVMIVDDEETIRRGLSLVINWQELDCCVCSEAADGVEAFEKIMEDAEPDIVITDIRMPGMDGLELSKCLSEKFPRIKIIILTGYADFEYARTAIQYGVVDFILKPTETDKITAAVQKAVSLLQSELSREEQILKLKNTVTSNLPEMREKLVSDCVNSVLSDPSIIKNKMQELQMEAESIIMVLAEFDVPYDDAADIPNIQHDSCGPVLRNIMDMAFKDYTHWCALLDDSHCCTVVSTDKAINEQHMQNILSLCRSILEMTDSSSSIKAFLGISGIVDTPWDFRKAYEQALHALSHNFLNNNAISFYVEGFSNGEPEIKAIQSVIDQIINSVKLGKTQSSTEHINSLFKLLIQNKSSFQRIRDITVFVASSLAQLLPDIMLEKQDEVGKGGDPFSRIFKTYNTDKLKRLLDNLASIIANKLIKSEHNNNIIINKVNEYISKNYMKNIRLPDIAESVYVNSSYLSRLFRQETGYTLTEAIAHYRIEKAKEFLIKPEIKTYEVANLVGIEDSAYFSMLFKRYAGISPTEYRQMATIAR